MRTGTVVDAKMSLALWLRAGRAQRGMSLEAVAKVTKIQPRILERLEQGKLDGLPADVFVRGFVRSFARCVGLDEAEAIKRYGACAINASPQARAVVEAMADLAPRTASPRILREVVAEPQLAAGSLQDLPMLAPAMDEPEPVVVSEAVIAKLEETFAAPEPEVAVEAAPLVEKKKRKSRGGKGRKARKDMATGTPVEPSPVVAAPAVEASAAEPVAEPIVIAADEPTPALEPILDPPPAIDVIEAAAEPTEIWAPKMPPAAPSVPWRRPHTIAAAAVPSLVIDDADPDSAERVREQRVSPKERRSFLPPILLDREDRGARQGGLTLAVIILLVAATLTLSYLMRRPSASGDGMTRLDERSESPFDRPCREAAEPGTLVG